MLVLGLGLGLRLGLGFKQSSFVRRSQSYAAVLPVGTIFKSTTLAETQA